jgi:predicted transcriptional regulator
MDGSTTLTVRLDTKLKKKLGKLAESTDRSKSYLAAAAIMDYVERESAIVESIKQRLAESRSPNAKFIPHEEAIAMVRATINKIAHRKANKA